MKSYVYANKFFLKDTVMCEGYLKVVNGKFGNYQKEPPLDSSYIIDHKGKWIAPGLVDTHIHGLLNHDVMDNDVEGLKAISEGLLCCGVTSFLPTTLTASTQLINHVVKTIGKHYKDVQGAKIQGNPFRRSFFYRGI